MAFLNIIVVCACVAVASAGNLSPFTTYAAPAPAYYGPPPIAYAAAPAHYTTGAITSQSSNIHRSFGNLGQISTYSKTVDTPYSSVSKSDVRISNPGLKYASHAVAPLSYAAPVAPLSYAVPAAPVAPLSYAAPVPVAHGPPHLLGVAYSAAPAVAHVTYAANIGSYEW